MNMMDSFLGVARSPLGAVAMVMISIWVSGTNPDNDFKLYKNFKLTSVKSESSENLNEGSALSTIKKFLYHLFR